MVLLVYGSRGTLLHVCVPICVAVRSEQWGNGRKGDDDAGTATHYIIQAKLCLSSYRAVNIFFFATMNTFHIQCSIRSFDRVVNLC